jgi:hypothetical protein
MNKFSRKSFSRKTLAIGIGMVLLSGGGIAYGYWSNTGTGTGAATTGTNAGITVVQTTSIAGLYPGQSAVTLAGNFTNTNAGATYVTAVTAPSYTIDATHVTAGCTVAGGHYTLGGTATVGANVPAGTAQGSWTGLTITMNNLGTNQDFCKGATVTVNYASS